MESEDKIIQERMKMAARWVSCADEVARKTGDKQAGELVQFLYDHTALMVPRESGRATQLGRGLSPEAIKARLMPITKLDVSDPESTAFGWDKEGYVASVLGHNSIVVRDFVAMTRIWRGLVLLHETLHAKELVEQQYDIRDANVFSAHERDAFIMEIRLVRLLGGEKYKELLEGVKVPAVSSKLDLSGKRVDIPSPGKYEKRLDEVFGVAKSRLERRVRQTVFWIDAVFCAMDSKAKDPELDKLYFMRTLYKKSTSEVG